jgi:phosphatidate phosphatase APP1
MSARPHLKDFTRKGIAAAERSLDRFRYDILGKKEEETEPHILAYYGYRTDKRLILKGRLVESWPGHANVSDASFAKVRNMLRLYESDELPGETVEIEVMGQTHRLESDQEGYFTLDIAIDRPLPERTEWEKAELRAPGLSAATVVAEILAPGRHVRRAVISDIVDTVLETGVSNFLANWRRILMELPEERIVVKGAPDLYNMLHGGEGERAPIFYVSSSPWNLFSYLARFMQKKHLPQGPMFLKDYGVDDAKFIAAPHTEHKIEAVRHILELYPQMQFLCIGDDGEKDVDVYAEASREHPERVIGVFVRDVHGTGRSPRHKKALAELESRGIKVYFGQTLGEATPIAESLGFGRAQEEAPAA